MEAEGEAFELRLPGDGEVLDGVYYNDDGARVNGRWCYRRENPDCHSGFLYMVFLDDGSWGLKTVRDGDPEKDSFPRNPVGLPHWKE